MIRDYEYRRGTPAGQSLRRSGAELAVEHSPRPLPQGHMVPIHGDRDETCVHYLDCLDAHVRAHTGRCEREPGVSCPAACRWREAVRERATAYMYSADGGARQRVGYS